MGKGRAVEMILGKPWKCRNGHVLGMAVRNGSGAVQLLLYRQAIGEEGEGEVEVMGIVEYALELRCSICGGVRTWVPGPETLRRLMKRRQE